MKPQELRIGNLVHNHHGFQMQVVGIFEDEILLDFEGNEGDVWQFSKKELELLQGIPLNEEWFFKLGFEKTPRQYWLKPNSSFFFGISLELGVLYLFDDEMPIPTECKHVHQLQNLYYALTNEELTQKNEIKP